MLSIKKKIKRYISKKYIHQFFLTLTTQYWEVLKDIDLNFLINEFVNPKLNLVNQDQNWKTFSIGNIVINWPIEYQNKGLVGLYNETFAPYKINPHAYESKEINISEGDWVIDAGACEGYFTHYALIKKANVLAIEPIPRLAEALKITFHQEIKEGRVIVLNAGVGKDICTSNIQIDEKEVYCSTVSEEPGIEISITTIDEILRKRIIPTIDFIKMDIEGGEVDAIIGARNTLKSKPKIAIAVYHKYDNAEKIRRIINNSCPDYKITYRGAFIRSGYGPPRPYILHAR